MGDGCLHALGDLEQESVGSEETRILGNGDFHMANEAALTKIEEAGEFARSLSVYFGNPKIGKRNGNSEKKRNAERAE